MAHILGLIVNDCILQALKFCNVEKAHHDATI